MPRRFPRKRPLRLATPSSPDSTPSSPTSSVFSDSSERTMSSSSSHPELAGSTVTDVAERDYFAPAASLEKYTKEARENFSAGTRGVTSAEYFLESGYAVIFLHRQFSLQPYSRHYSHATNCFVDFLYEGPDGSVVANEEYRSKILMALRQYSSAKKTKPSPDPPLYNHRWLLNPKGASRS
jgi:phosphopantothenate-cysteine ligase